MISFVKGALVESRPTEIVVDAGGLGYRIAVPLSTYDALPPEGETVTVLTHLHVREDAMDLYGFATPQERELFRMLLSVSGVGPKLALAILSGVSVGAFTRAVGERSVKVLSTIPGIGRKTAERLIVELKDRVAAPAPGGGGLPAGVPPEAGGKFNDAVLALASLGYKAPQARKAVERVLRKLGGEPSLEEIVREALKGGS